MLRQDTYLGEAGVSLITRYEEVAALFSSSYYICPDRVSFAVIVEEIKLHGSNN